MKLWQILRALLIMAIPAWIIAGFLVPPDKVLPATVLGLVLGLVIWIIQGTLKRSRH
jgi:hypothetical protein